MINSKGQSIKLLRNSYPYKGFMLHGKNATADTN